MEDKKIVSCEIINAVRVITYDDGSQHFEPIEQKKRSFFQILKDWWNDKNIKPYVKTRDLADPFDERTDADKGCDGKQCIEAGIKISF